MKKNKGFTLIELMVVIAIIGVLSAVAMPKFRDMLEKSREGATKANIGTIMSAISVYHADVLYKYPENIADKSFEKYISVLPAVKVTHPHGGYRLSGKSNEVELLKEPPGKGKGKALGVNKFKDNTDGWRYDPETGGVWVNNSQNDTTGLCYTLYGYE